MVRSGRQRELVKRGQSLEDHKEGVLVKVDDILVEDLALKESV